MTIIKNRDIDSFLSKPNSKIKLFLFYGPNHGLSYERANTLAISFAKSSISSSLITKINEDDVFESPDCLTSIMSSADFFNVLKVVYIKNGSRNILPAIQKYISDAISDVPVIIVAGDVSRSHALRSFMEINNNCAVIANYADERNEASNILKSSLESSNIKLSPAITNLILDNMSGDRLILRSEINKIVTYCGSEKNITSSDIQKLIGDTSSFAIQNLIDNAFCGNKKQVEQIYGRLQESKDDQSILCSMVLNHLIQLINILDQSKTDLQINNNIMQLNSIHFSRRNSIAIQLKKWNAENIVRLISHTQKQINEIRKNVNLKNTIANRLLLKICTLSLDKAR